MFLGADHFVESRQFHKQNVTVEKQQGRFRLILSRWGDIQIDGQMGEECGDFDRTHFGGMTFAMEQDEAARPINVGVLGSDRVVSYANLMAKLVEETRR